MNPGINMGNMNAAAGPSNLNQNMGGGPPGVNMSAMPPNVQHLYSLLQNPGNPFVQYVMQQFPGFATMPVASQIQKMIQIQNMVQRKQQEQHQQQQQNQQNSQRVQIPGGGQFFWAGCQSRFANATAAVADGADAAERHVFTTARWWEQ